MKKPPVEMPNHGRREEARHGETEKQTTADIHKISIFRAVVKRKGAIPGPETSRQRKRHK